MASNHDQKTLGSYLLGMALCLVLTFASFGLVEYHLLSKHQTYIALSILAVAQLLVQSVCFLRLNAASDEGKANLYPFLFTSLVVVILVGGSMWVIYNLNYNMLLTY